MKNKTKQRHLRQGTEGAVTSVESAYVGAQREDVSRLTEKWSGVGSSGVSTWEAKPRESAGQKGVDVLSQWSSNTYRLLCS